MEFTEKLASLKDVRITEDRLGIIISCKCGVDTRFGAPREEGDAKCKGCGMILAKGRR